MIIAVPIEDGKLCSHFGHCSSFAVFHTTDDGLTITGRNDVDAPPHKPGLLPTWLYDLGVNTVICGGMGPMAIDLLSQKGVKVITGAQVMAPEEIVRSYLCGTFVASSNSCDH